MLCVACTICCWKCSKFVNWNSVWFAFFLWVVDWSKRHFLFWVVKKWHVFESVSDVSWKIAFQDDSFQSHAFLFCLQHTFVRYTQPYSSSTVELIITFGNLSSFASVSHTPTMFCCKGKVATPHYVHWPNPNKRWFLEGEFFAFWKRTYSRRPITQEESRLNHPEKHTKHSSNGSTTPVVWQQIVGGEIVVLLFFIREREDERVTCMKKNFQLKTIKSKD